MLRRTRPVISITLPLLLWGCKHEAPPAPQQEVTASSLPRITVNEHAKSLFTFARPDGTFETVDKLKDVPEARRGWVRIVDLKMKPTKRMDHELVYVADLREKRKDGTFPYVVLPRTSFESAAVNRAGTGAAAKPGEQAASSGVILYATSWCPACRAARDYMKQHGIPFVEKDIEQDRDAAAELLQKARGQGISASGVPVLDVNGTLMQGFDPNRLNALLGDKK